MLLKGWQLFLNRHAAERVAAVLLDIKIDPFLMKVKAGENREGLIFINEERTNSFNGRGSQC
jgi:hypothetical protein